MWETLTLGSSLRLQVFNIKDLLPTCRYEYYSDSEFSFGWSVNGTSIRNTVHFENKNILMAAVVA